MSKLRVNIKDPTVETKSGNKNGRDWSIREQTGFIELNGETRRVRIALGKDDAPRAAGLYEFDLLEHMRFGKYGLEFDDRLKLSPVQAGK